MNKRHTTTKIYFLVLSAALVCGVAGAQAVKGSVSAEDPPPPLTFAGLVPGLSTMEQVRAALGEPVLETHWYDYKLYYPAKDRSGLFDVVHMHSDAADAGLANIDAASVPEGYETGPAIRAKLGKPEYELRMATWRLLDYTEQGLRFSLTPDGKTTGVAYIPHGTRRVPEGERAFLDLSALRQGPQPAPPRLVDLGTLQAGASQIEFTPTGEDWLGHRYTVHDPLKARTAVFSDGRTTVAFVGADLFGMGWREINVIREGARALGVDHTVVAMSHNHAAGDTIGVYGHYPAEYIAHIQQQLIEGIRQAVAELRPVGSLLSASRELPMDGTRVQGLFRNARNPGVLDPTISVLRVMGIDNKPITTLVHFACHAESLEKGPREISADFPGYLCDTLDAELGGQTVFLNGALGGMVSGDNERRTHESSREMGLELATIVQDLLKTAQPPARHVFSVDRRRLEIPMSNPEFAALYESGLRSLHEGRVVTDMMYIQLGDAQFITLPGELLPELGFEILERMDGFPRMLIGLANDELGYMIPAYDFRADSYEESMSQGPAAGLQVRDMALRMLSGVK